MALSTKSCSRMICTATYNLRELEPVSGCFLSKHLEGKGSKEEHLKENFCYYIFGWGAVLCNSYEFNELVCKSEILEQKPSTGWFCNVTNQLNKITFTAVYL